MVSSSSPITSASEPSQGSGLASVITQVQPGHVASARPVRPRKPAANVSTAAADAAKKKKKKKRIDTQRGPHAEASGSTRPDAVSAVGAQKAAVRAAAAAGSSDALRQSHGPNAASSETAPLTLPQTNTLALETADKADDTDHSHQPSATLVDDPTTGSVLNAAETTASTPAPAPLIAAAASQPRSFDKAAEKLASESSQGTAEREGLITVPTNAKTSIEGSKAKESAAPSTARPAATTQTSAAAKVPADAATEKARQKKPGFAQRMIAIITCSSGTRTMVEEDFNNEKRKATHGRSEAGRARADGKTGGTALPTGVVVPPRTPNSKGGSRLGADDGASSIGPTTPGGGTRLPREETGNVMSGAVVLPGASFVTPDDFTGACGAGAGVGLGLAPGAAAATAQQRRPRSLDDMSKTESDVDDDYDDEDEDNEDDDDMDPDGDYLDDDQTEEQRLIMQGGMGIAIDEYGNPQPLLGPIVREDTGRKCLVLDLDETLVHSSFKVMPADFIVPVEIEGTVHNVYVIKRPGVDEFMRRMGEIYEVVVFTASLSKYADPVLDMLDIHHAVRHRLFRESCYNHKGNYVKDLSQLGRDIGDTIIIDNSPASYIFHPNNAVPISSWFNDPHDTELTDLCPFLADLCEVDDVRAVLDGGLF